MAIDQSLLEILCCPVTKSPPHRLDRQRVKRLAKLCTDGDLAYSDGRPVAGPIGEALIAEDGLRIYLVEDGIPVLLEDRAIPGDVLSTDD